MTDADREKLRLYMEFDESDPRFQVRLLAIRLDNLGQEKEDIEQDLREERLERKKLEERIAAMERSFQRGAGALIVLPVIGTIVGVLFAYGKTILAPWIPK